MKPFNLEDWKAGKPVITRNGDTVEQLTFFNTNDSSFKLAGVVLGILHRWNINGKFYCTELDSHLDLFHPEEEMWVAVYINPFDKAYHVSPIFLSKEDAIQICYGVEGAMKVYKLVKDE